MSVLSFFITRVDFVIVDVFAGAAVVITVIVGVVIIAVTVVLHYALTRH